MYKEIIEVLEKEVEFYSNKYNSDWDKSMNDGFRFGIKYCRDLIKTMETKEIFINNKDIDLYLIDSENGI